MRADVRLGNTNRKLLRREREPEHERRRDDNDDSREAVEEARLAARVSIVQAAVCSPGRMQLNFMLHTCM